MYRIILLILIFLSACSDDDSRQGHVWEEQAATIDRAKEVEKVIMDSAEEQNKMIEQQTR